MLTATVIGLLLNTLGAILLVFFPPVVRRFTKDGAPEVSWAGNVTTSGKLRGYWQPKLASLGFILLASGFLVQIYDAYRPSRAASRARYLACTFTDDKHTSHERAFVLELDRSLLTDAYGDAWKVTLNTPVRLAAEHEEKFAGQDLGVAMLELNRLSGSATISRLAASDKKANSSLPPFPPGIRQVESEQTGRCAITAYRAIE